MVITKHGDNHDASLTMPMAKTWTDKTEFKTLSNELAVTEGLAFQRKLLPLLRILFPDTVEAPPQRSIDQRGIDLLCWGQGSVLPLVVQAKGFSVREAEIGASQAQQFLRSIRDFQQSGLKADTYLLIHNRDNRKDELRLPLERELASMVETGQVRRAELWDRQQLLTEAFGAMLRYLRESLARPRRVGARSNVFDKVPLLSAVPYSLSTLVMDQYKLTSISTPKRRIADPTQAIVPPKGYRFTFLIGEFGFGKTTTVLRAATSATATLLHVPAAVITTDIVGTKDLAIQCIDTEQLLAPFLEEDRPVLRLIARGPIEYLLKDPRSPLILVFDGLDESPFLARRGGLNWFVNFLYQLRVPVILTARTEFWRTRQADFGSSFGAPLVIERKRTMKAQLVELLPWEPEQILALVEAFATSLKEQTQRSHVLVLAGVLRTKEFDQYYGDIPKRPLFLRCILDCVVAMGVHAVGRAQLMEEWVSMKITRDLTNPGLVGGIGRLPITSDDEGLTATLALAYKAMEAAALAMTTIDAGNVELTPSCTLSQLQTAAADKRLDVITDPTGLVLNSLLTPVANWHHTTELALQFAHRAFQEYFLARALVRRSTAITGTLPAEIQQWIDALAKEGVLQAPPGARTTQ
jgi:hypothetical protein